VPSLLLDAHLSPRIAHQVLAHNPAVDIISPQEWDDGAYLGADDATILGVAREQGRTLVTRDARTIMAILKDCGARGVDHAGVIFADHRSFAEGNVGSMVSGLLQLWEAESAFEWANAVRYLRYDPDQASPTENA
jgi:hypothetical protein